MAFMGSYIMVIAFERANLHHRLALKILTFVGSQPRWLLFGTMMSACFLSMFTNNTVSCALHLPIVKGIIDELRVASRSRAVSISEPRHDRSHESRPSISEEHCHEQRASASEERSESVIEMESVTSGETATTSTEPAPALVDVNINKNTPHHTPTLTGKYHHHHRHPNRNGVINDPESGLSCKMVTRLEKMLLTAAAYSATIGGMVTIIGTPTNLIFKERVDEVFESYNCTSNPITFTSWLVLGVPVAYIFIILGWFWLQFFWLGPKYMYRVWIVDQCQFIFRRLSQEESEDTRLRRIRMQKQSERVTNVIAQLHQQLEPMGFQQYAVLGHCIVLVILLITRQISAGDETHEVIGWGAIAPHYVEESTAAILVTASLFLFPSKLPNPSLRRPPPPLLKWSQVQESFPIGVILLLGGGIAATYGAQQSGLPLIIAPFFYEIIKDLPFTFSILVTSITVAGLTEVMSNVACFTFLSPIMEELVRNHFPNCFNFTRFFFPLGL